MEPTSIFRSPDQLPLSGCRPPGPSCFGHDGYRMLEAQRSGEGTTLHGKGSSLGLHGKAVILFLFIPQGGTQMKCPVCGFPESKVIDSRPTDTGSIRRRRECLSCKKRFTTYEIIDAVPVAVVKKDGSEELFDRNKILSGLLKSCYKRPVTREQLNALISAHSGDHYRNRHHGDGPSAEAGRGVLCALRFGIPGIQGCGNLYERTGKAPGHSWPQGRKELRKAGKSLNKRKPGAAW